MAEAATQQGIASGMLRHPDLGTSALFKAGTIDECRDHVATLRASGYRVIAHWTPDHDCTIL